MLLRKFRIELEVPYHGPEEGCTRATFVGCFDLYAPEIPRVGEKISADYIPEFPGVGKRRLIVNDVEHTPIPGTEPSRVDWSQTWLECTLENEGDQTSSKRVFDYLEEHDGTNGGEKLWDYSGES